MTSKTILTPEQRAEARRKVDALNAEAAARFFEDPSFRHEAAAVITEEILWGFEQENIVSLLADVDYVARDDRVTVSQMRGMRAFWIAPGGYAEESNVRRDVFEITRDTIQMHVSEFEDKLESNFALTQQNLISLGGQRLAGEINLRVLRTFQEAVPTSSPYCTVTSGMTLAELNTAIARVGDASLGAPITLVGRRSMTDKIISGIINLGSGYGAFVPETNETLIQTGVLGQYRGAQIVTLKNYLDDEDLPFFPGNELWVVAPNASKFAFWGAPKTKDFVEEDNWFWHYIYRQDFGGAVWRPERLQRIIDSSVDA